MKDSFLFVLKSTFKIKKFIQFNDESKQQTQIWRWYDDAAVEITTEEIVLLDEVNVLVSWKIMKKVFPSLLEHF